MKKLVLVLTTAFSVFLFSQLVTTKACPPPDCPDCETWDPDANGGEGACVWDCDSGQDCCDDSCCTPPPEPCPECDPEPPGCGSGAAAPADDCQEGCGGGSSGGGGGSGGGGWGSGGDSQGQGGSGNWGPGGGGWGSGGGGGWGPGGGGESSGGGGRDPGNWCGNGQPPASGGNPPPRPKKIFGGSGAGSGGDARSGAGGTAPRTFGHPIQLHSGEFYENIQDLRIQGRGGLDVVWSRYYRSRFGTNTAMGNNWDYSYNIYLEADGDDILLHDGEHRSDAFSDSDEDGTYESNGFFRELKAEGTDYYKMQFSSTGYWLFYDFDYATTYLQGKLKEIGDRNENKITFTYNTSGQLTMITDTYGREIDVTWSNGKISEIEDFAERTVSYDYYDGQEQGGNEGDLKSVTSPVVTSDFGNGFASGKTVTYTYDTTTGAKKHNLLTITDARGNQTISNHYNNDDKVDYQEWGEGRIDFYYHKYTTSWEWENSQWVLHSTEPDDAVLVTIVNDRVGNVTQTYFDQSAHVIRVRKYNGRAANVAAQTTLTTNRPGTKPRGGDPIYHEYTWEFNSDHRLTKSTDGNGNTMEITYQNGTGETKREHGNVLQRKFTSNENQSTIEHNYTYGDLSGCGCGSNFVETYIGPEDDVNNKFEQTFDSKGNVKSRTQPKVTLQNGSFQKNIQTVMQLSTPGEQEIKETWDYNNFGLVKKYTDPEGNVTEYEYYPENDPDGDGENIISGRDDEEGVDGGGYLKKVTVDTTSAAGRNSGTNPAVVNIPTYIEYDRVGNVTAVYDGRGVRSEYDVNELDQVVEIRWAAPVPQGETNPITPSPSEPLTLTAYDYQERIWYDENDNVILRQVEDYGNTSEVDGNMDSDDLEDVGLDSADPDPVGGDDWQETLTKYDDQNNPIEIVQEVTKDQWIYTKHRYNKKDQWVLTVYPEGNADSYSYDTQDLPFQATRGASSEPADLVKLTGDPGTWTFNRPGGSGTTASVTTYNYDDNGNLIQIVDTKDHGGVFSTIHGDGDVTRISYDGFNWPKMVTDPLCNKTHYTYDDGGKVVRIIQEGDPTDDGAGTTGNITLKTTEFIYDEVGRQVMMHELLFETPYVTLASGRNLTLTDNADMDNLALYLSDASSDTSTTGVPAGVTVIGRITTITEYDRNSRVTHRITDDFDVMRMMYDGAGRVIETTDSALNNGWDDTNSKFVNSGAGCLDGNTTKTAYDDNGNAIEILRTDVTDVSNVADETFRTTNFYDSLNRLILTVDNDGNATDMFYDSRNNLVARADASGPVTTDTINRRGLGSTASVDINDFGNVTRTYYDGLSRIVETETMLTDDGVGDGLYIGANDYGVKVAPSGYLDTNQSGDGLISVYYAYDDNSQLLGLRDDNGNVTAYFYDNQNRQLVERKGLYASGTSLDVDKDNNSGTTDDIITLNFNVSLRGGATVVDSEANGTDITFAYDEDSLVTSRTDEAGNVLAYTYDGNHRRKSLSVTKATGFVGTTSQTLKYDGLNRLTDAFDNNGTGTDDDVTCTWAYDSLSHLVEETQQIGSSGSTRAVTCNFDAAKGSVRRDTSCIYPDGRQVDNTYDALDRLISRNDNSYSDIGTYEYLGKGRVAVMTYQNGTRLTYIGQSGGNADLGYDNLGRPINHRWESFDTDDLGEGDLIVGFEHQDSSGNSLYDRVHNKKIEHKTHDTDNSEMYAYDSAYRLTDPSSSTENGFRRGDFDDGDRDSMSTPNYYADWQLDGLGNWESEWQNSATAQTRKHSDFNEIVYHGAPVSHWKLNETTGTTASDSVGDNDGTLNNFTGTYWVTGKVDNGLEFDGSDDYVALLHMIDPANDSFSAFAWVRLDTKDGDISQTILQQEDNGATTGRTWLMRHAVSGSDEDKLASYLGGELTLSETVVFTDTGEWHHVGITFDGTTLKLYIDGQWEVSNDITVEEATGDMRLGAQKVPANSDFAYWDGVLDNVLVFDRVLADEEIEALYEAADTHGSELPMTHDANGNLTRNREGVTMEYDALNRLKEVISVDGDTVALYVYDAHNRRMQKIVQNGGLPDDSNLDGTTRYYYHGWRVLEERDGSGNIQRQFTYGEYLDEVWTIDDRDGVTIANLNDSSSGTAADRHFAHSNTLYHVYGLTNEDGDLVEGYQYDAYGKATVFTDGNSNGTVDFDGTDDTADWSSVKNPYQYTGQRYDPETGWMYYKNRYYDTDLGRFISRDLIGYEDGLNLYEYVKSHPIMNVDPLGKDGQGICQDYCMRDPIVKRVETALKACLGCCMLYADGANDKKARKVGVFCVNKSKKPVKDACKKSAGWFGVLIPLLLGFCILICKRKKALRNMLRNCQ